MTPGARIAAAADLLDRILAGEPGEKALTDGVGAVALPVPGTVRRSAIWFMKPFGAGAATRSSAARNPGEV